MTNKKKPLFWKIYFCILGVAFAALIVGLIWLNGFLSDYEAAQPKHIAKEVYEEHFKNFDAEKYLDLCGTESGIFETRENVISYLNDLTKEAEISYYGVSTGLENSYKYIVKADDTRFASFTLSVDDEAKNRFTTYKTDIFELYVDSNMKCTIEAPKGYSVSVNGIPVDESYITEPDIKSASCDYMPEGVSGIIYNKYTISGLVSKPHISVKSPEGADSIVTGENGEYNANVVFDEELKNEYNDWIIKAAEKYAVYMQYDSSVAAVSFGQVSPYFDPKSELYEDIRTVENGFVIEYTSYEFADEETSEFTRYDDNTFSCRINLTQILHRKGESDYNDHLDLTLYLRDTGKGKYLIYNMSSN